MTLSTTLGMMTSGTPQSIIGSLGWWTISFLYTFKGNIKLYFQSNVTIRVIAPENKISQANFALDQAVQITQNYERFFGIDYPLPKQGL